MPKLSTTLLILTFAVLISACSEPRHGSWIPVDTNTGDAFYTVNFVNDKEGWLNGQSDRNDVPDELGKEQGKDANKNAPSKKPTPTPDPSKKPENPLLANQGFEVLHTADGGHTWTQLVDQFKNKIRSVWFVTPELGWALTIDRDLMQTTNAGQTWTLQRKAGTVKLKLTGNRRTPEMDVPEQVDHIYFMDSKRGWAWGGGRKDDYTDQPGTFLLTTNGGANWNEVPFPFEQAATSIFFMDARHAWASVAQAGLYTTTDGGLNWSKVEGKLPEVAFGSMFFLDPTHGWAVGRSGRLSKTEDGGHTWRKMVEIKEQYVMRSIFFSNPKTGWVAGDNGAIIYTPDGGDTWTALDTGVQARLLDIRFVNGTVGWAAGLEGAVVQYQGPPAAK